MSDGKGRRPLTSKELYELMKDLGSRKEPFIKNGFGTKWLGCMVDALGKDWRIASGYGFIVPSKDFQGPLIKLLL